LLDIGCGIAPQNYIHPQVHICCEPYKEYVARLQNDISNMDVKDRQYVVLNMGWHEVVRYFPEKSVDTIILADVIEHLEKEEGRELLRATEKIARQQVILFTPYGFMPQHLDSSTDGWGLSGGAWQEHKSGWMPEDFEGDGWQFIAAREYHTEDSLGQRLEKPYGAFWAVKTYPQTNSASLIEREKMLQQLAATYRQKEDEINNYLLVRIEKKLRRIFFPK